MRPGLQQIIDKAEEYIGGLIDVADMSPDDRAALKANLKAVEGRLSGN